MPVISPNKRKSLATILRGFEGDPGDYDPDVQAWLQAINDAGGSVSTAQADAVNAYWILQKAAGLDLLAIADYPFVGDQIAMEHNLKAPGSFRLDFVDTEPSQFTTGGWKPGPRPVGQESSGIANTRITYDQVNLAEADSFTFRFRGETSSDIFQVILGNSNPDNADQRGWNVVKNGQGNNNVISLTYFDQNGLRLQILGSTAIDDGVVRTIEVNYNGSGFGILGNFQILLDGVAEALSFGDQDIAGGSQPAVSNLVAFNYDNRDSGNRRPWLGTCWNLFLEKNGTVFIDSLINEGIGTDIGNTGAAANGVLSDPNATFWGQTVNSFADSGIIPSTDLVENDVSLEYYSRTDNNQVSIEIGARNGAAAQLLRMFFNPTCLFECYNNTNDAGRVSAPSNGTTLGQLIGSRVSNIDAALYQNGQELGRIASVAGSPGATVPIAIGATNDVSGPSNFSVKESAGAGIYAGLTPDLAAQFFISREIMNQLLNRSALAFGGTLIEYIENVNRVGGSLTGTEILAAAVYLAEITQAGIEPLADYPMLGGSEAAHAISLYNNNDFELEFNGGWVHSATGALPNGVDAFAETFISPLQVMIVNNTSLEYYSRGAESADFPNPIGVIQGTDRFTITRSGDDAWRSDSYNNEIDQGRLNYVDEEEGLGHVLQTRQDALNHRVLRNGSLRAENQTSGGTLPGGANTVYLGALNNQGAAAFHSTVECSGAMIGPGFGLSQAEAQSFARMLMNEIAGRAVYTAEAAAVHALMTNLTARETVALAIFVDEMVRTGLWAGTDDIVVLALQDPANSLIGLRGNHVGTGPVGASPEHIPGSGWLVNSFDNSGEHVGVGITNAGPLSSQNDAIFGAFVFQAIPSNDARDLLFDGGPNGSFRLRRNGSPRALGSANQASGGTLTQGASSQFTANTFHAVRRNDTSSVQYWENGVNVTSTGGTAVSAVPGGNETNLSNGGVSFVFSGLRSVYSGAQMPIFDRMIRKLLNQLNPSEFPAP